MILNTKPLTMAEVKEKIKDSDAKDVKDYLKKFCKLSEEKANKLKEELNSLGNVKLNEEYLTKLIDFLPRDVEDFNKIFYEISLDEKETNEILEIVKKY